MVAGFGRGRQIGFPTANLAVELSQVIPARGVYFCLAAVPGRAGSFGAMINIGTNPTFGLGRLSIEAHLLDFEGDLVGATVSLFFVHRLRDERKFESVEALVDQLRRDKDHARRLLDAPESAGAGRAGGAVGAGAGLRSRQPLRRCRTRCRRAKNARACGIGAFFRG